MQNRPDFSTTHRWLIITAVMLAAMLESLDMTVTSVALPNLMGVFDVSSNSISWVITAYVTATAIVMPIVGLLVSRVGRKRLLLISTLGFALFSFSCGMVDHFDQMIFFRTLQGLFSAALIPLAQSIVINTFPKEQCNKALAIWSSGIVIACVLGPTVGGCILQTLGWRWIFFLNIPICFLVLVLTCFYISESEREHAKIDWLGFISLIIFAGLLQLLIDRGTKLDWFASRLITYGIIIMIISAVFFIFRGIKLKDKSVIDFAIFKDRNYTVAVIATIFFNASFMGVSTLLPIFLENFLNFTPIQTGLLSLPGGASWLLGTAFGAILIKIIDSRLLLIFGLIIGITGSLFLSQMTITTSPHRIQYLLTTRNFGYGITFIVLLTLSMFTVPQKLYAMSTGVYNFARTIGGSIGISYASSQLNSYMQESWNHLSGYISPYQTGLKFWLVQQHVMPHMSYKNPVAVGIFTKTLAQQSYVQAFNSSFFVLMLVFSCILFSVFLFKKVKITQLSVGH